MMHTTDRGSGNRCALDAKQYEPFTQKAFSDLIFDAHSKGQDYYIARLQCRDADSNAFFYSYDSKHLCKFVFEMIISSEGRQIRIKNFKDPIHNKDIMEINFFRMRYDSETPLKAEYAGNHISFLESNTFRSKIFGAEEAMDALSVNFKFKKEPETKIIAKRKFLMFLTLTLVLLVFGALSYAGVLKGKEYMAANSTKQAQVMKVEPSKVQPKPVKVDKETPIKKAKASKQAKTVKKATNPKTVTPKMIKMSPTSLKLKAHNAQFQNDAYIKV